MVLIDVNVIERGWVAMIDTLVSGDAVAVAVAVAVVVVVVVVVIVVVAFVERVEIRVVDVASVHGGMEDYVESNRNKQRTGKYIESQKSGWWTGEMPGTTQHNVEKRNNVYAGRNIKGKVI